MYNYNMYNMYICIICSSSPLSHYKLPEDENKVIYLNIRLVLRPLLLSLCPLFFNRSYDL